MPAPTPSTARVATSTAMFGATMAERPASMNSSVPNMMRCFLLK